MNLSQYIDSINQRYKLGNATEHTFRGDLQQLIESIVPDVRATNEPKRQSCGAPDYILTKKDIPVGFIEAKDIGDKDLNGKKKTGNKEQFDRYKSSLNNLIFTDYLEFHLYRDGEFITKIAIGEVVNGKINPLTENFKTFESFLRDFCTHISQTIKNSKRLAEMMAGKARLLSDVIEKALTSDEVTQENSTLKEQMLAFKDILIHDITPKGFADVYAQTIAYGMFAARLHDPTLETFSRQEAAELIPKSNPFLRKLFGYIAGPDIDDRIKWIVDNLTEIFLACNVEEILKNYGKSTKMEDPIIHFYETFLAEYDPKLRKARGVWYTPQPVVNFIVRAVDDILKTEFYLPQGLADTSKTTIKVNTQTPDKRSATGYKQAEQEVHKVQILDPATGTGTFLAEVVKHVNKKFKGQEGIWSSYVENNLLPRLNGFELLMASYAMAHLQIDLLLKDTGFKPQSNQRTRIYLTNSLEEHHPDTGTLFANWLSSEANEANHIKRDTPVMCIIGNPPYAVSSSNKGNWIMNLLEDYKREPGGKEKLNERNSKVINDDYVKFLRYGQHYIEKNGTGILAFINPHGFLDNPTFRGMRWNLLKTYDKIYTIDLHGNSKKKETTLDGSPDVNVFDIQQGVSINLFVKTGKKKASELGKVFNFDLFGKREFKYDFLNNNSLKSINFIGLPNKAPDFFMVQKDFELEEEYNSHFSLDKVFPSKVGGIKTHRDNFIIDFDINNLKNKISKFYNLDFSNEELITTYDLNEKNDWLQQKRKGKLDPYFFQKIDYRPFDCRNIYYNADLIDRPRLPLMNNFFQSNIGMIFSRQATDANWTAIQVSNNITDNRFHFSYKGIPLQAPLYLYTDNNNQQSIEENNSDRQPNLNPDIVKEIESKLGLTFIPDHEVIPETFQIVVENKLPNEPVSRPEDYGYFNAFTPLDVLDYIYAVLHSPSYREKYKEFLKIDFPRVPYPKDQDTFWKLVNLGGELREIHLLESPVVENYITSYPNNGDNKVTRKLTKTNIGYEAITETHGKVWINDEQFFDNVPLVAWEFYIGGYQPAQKWLKDRKDRVLDFEDILHYQKIIVALNETDKLMKAIDKIDIE